MKTHPRPVRPVASTVSSARFPSIVRPAWIDSLRFPEDLSSLTPGNLTELMARYTELFAYASYVATQASEQDLRLSTDELRRKGQFFRETPAVNNQARWKRDAAMNTDEALESLTVARTKCRIEMDWAKTYVAIYERYVQVLSRELTRRSFPV